MKTILPGIIAFLFFNTPVLSQTFEGIVKDKSGKAPLAYVNIGIAGKNVGTVSGMDGHFNIRLDERYDEDTLVFSMIGYKTLSMKIADAKASLLKNKEIFLEEGTFEFKEVVISDKPFKTKVLGNKTESKSLVAGFTSNELGNEVGIVIKIKKAPSYIKKFHVYIAKNEYDSVKFRLNFYTLKDGLPDKIMLSRNIIVQTTIKQGKLSVDLSDFLIVAEDDFLVSLEWIEDYGEDGLMFSAGFLGSSIIARHSSQASWYKMTGVSIGFNVTAKY